MRIVVAEDVALLREGLARLLEEDGHEVTGVADAESLLHEVERVQPDLVVTDVRMPPTFTDEGLRAALVIRSSWPDIRVIVLSQYVEEAYATELLAGRPEGVGYLLKERVADVGDFLADVARVGAGGTAFDPEVVSQLMARSRARDPLAELSPREREVLALMAEGRSNAAIAERLVITERAVEKHVSSIFTRLGLLPAADDHRRVLAVLTFIRSGR
jgi:DNA-binding NarL/FixJ family response regulator